MTGDQARPFLSVVVMGYHNEATIEAAVASLVEQPAATPPEVVVVTSGGDDSAAIVRRRFPGITAVDSPTRLLPGGARNVGIVATTGEVVAFLAADCLALPGWVDARTRRHRAGVAMVAGAMTAAPPASAARWAHTYLLFPARLPGRPSGALTVPQAAAHGLSFTRTLLDRLGGFDETVLVGEDTDAARRAGDLGAVAWFEPAVVTAHQGPSSTSGMLVDLWRRGRTAASNPAARPLPSRRAVARAVVLRCRHDLRRATAGVAANAGVGQPPLRAVRPWMTAGVVALELGWGRTQLSLRHRKGDGCGVRPA